MTTLKLLTNSRAKVARLCLRKHHNQYVLLRRAIAEAEELSFGTLMHSWLEEWWRPGVDAATRTERCWAVIDAANPEPFTKAKHRVMALGYEARWAGEPFVALAVEPTFTTPLLNPATGAASKRWQLAGKIDVIAQHTETGATVIVEHKSTKEDPSPGGTYWRILRMDTQISAYFTGAKALGHEAESCVYDVLVKPAIKPLKATPIEARKFKANGLLYASQRETEETPEQYFDRLIEALNAEPARFYCRIEVPRTEADLIDAATDLWQLSQQLNEAERLARAPRNVDRSSCLAFGRPCAYFDVCSNVASLDDDSIFKSTVAHPELEPTTAPTHEPEGFSE